MKKEVIGIAMTAVYELRNVFSTVNDLGMAGNLFFGGKRTKRRERFSNDQRNTDQISGWCLIGASAYGIGRSNQRTYATPAARCNGEKGDDQDHGTEPSDEVSISKSHHQSAGIGKWGYQNQNENSAIAGSRIDLGTNSSTDRQPYAGRIRSGIFKELHTESNVLFI